jgi:hypothetical protein
MRELSGVVVRILSARGGLLTERQLAGDLGPSTPWVALRVREGLLVLPRQRPGEHGRFDLEGVRAWPDGRSERACAPPSARARTIRDWSMVWLRDYARPVLSTQRSCCDAFRVVRPRWAQCERLELDELRPACATLLMERGLPPHVVANQLGHTDGGALVQRLYGHPSERGMREQIAFGSWGADEEQAPRDVPGNGQVS